MKPTHEETLNKHFDWRCPQCAAPARDHGPNTAACEAEDPELCDGLLCNCSEPHAGDSDHGQVWFKQCQKAICDHCGWKGRFPMGKDMSVPLWARTAIENGWIPPSFRRA